MNRIFTDSNAAELLQRNHPGVYEALREAVLVGMPRDLILSLVRRVVDDMKPTEDPEAGELMAGLAEMTVDYVLTITAQIAELERQIGGTWEGEQGAQPE